MVRGLLWMPLLVLFVWLAWAGWNEYQKVEAYKQWATSFERAKYDIYAALGQQGDVLTWGVPTRQGVVDADSVNMGEVEQVMIEVNGQPIAPDKIPARGRFAIGLAISDGEYRSIPFTDGQMARQWFEFLCRQWPVSSDTL